MGLFGFIGELVTLPVKIVAVPFQVVEKSMAMDDSYTTVTEEVTKAVTKPVEKAFKDLDGALTK